MTSVVFKSHEFEPLTFKGPGLWCRWCGFKISKSLAEQLRPGGLVLETSALPAYICKRQWLAKLLPAREYYKMARFYGRWFWLETTVYRASYPSGRVGHWMVLELYPSQRKEILYGRLMKLSDPARFVRLGDDFNLSDIEKFPEEPTWSEWRRK